MKKQVIVISFLGIILLAFAPGDFKKDQLRYKRVRTAFAEKDSLINQKLEKLGVKPEKLELFVRALKAERKLETWVKNHDDEKFQLYRSFSFCSFSGDLGPKRKQGDLQIPEGLYKIEIFNPVSSFYLSLGTSYPNASDKKRKIGTDPGGDIYLHGSCVTIGCIPIQDDGIKELYALSVLARDANKSSIQVHLFPFKMNDANMLKYGKKYPKHVDFWKEIQPFYQHFESKKQLPKFYISKEGAYKMTE
ncbi:MAG: L,D-transpeptidase family protein [Bacteroidetes bacterium]|nr:L,D-transpeptidase family protein [Bacteroidota bacterium]